MGLENELGSVRVDYAFLVQSRSDVGLSRSWASNGRNSARTKYWRNVLVRAAVEYSDRRKPVSQRKLAAKRDESKRTRRQWVDCDCVIPEISKDDEVCDDQERCAKCYRRCKEGGLWQEFHDPSSKVGAGHVECMTRIRLLLVETRFTHN